MSISTRRVRNLIRAILLLIYYIYHIFTILSPHIYYIHVGYPYIYYLFLTNIYIYINHNLIICLLFYFTIYYIYYIYYMFTIYTLYLLHTFYTRVLTVTLFCYVCFKTSLYFYLFTKEGPHSIQYGQHTCGWYPTVMDQLPVKTSCWRSLTIFVPFPALPPSSPLNHYSQSQ